MILNHKLRYIFIVMLVLGGIFLFTAVKIVNSLDYPNSDFFTFWLGGHLASLGENPYIAGIWIGGHHQFGASWIPNTTFIYPLPLSLLFAPLGLLSLYQAYVVWIVLSQFMIILSVALLMRLYPNQLNKHFILPLLAGVVLFRPTIITLINGQLSGFLLILLACIVFIWEKGKWWQGSVLLPILALKPNLGIPIIVLLIFYLILRRQMASLVAVGASSVVLLCIGLIQNANWVNEFLKAGGTKLSQTFGFSPTVWGIAAYLSGFRLNPTLVLGGLAAIVLLVGCLILMVRHRESLSPAMACSMAITTTLLITPYTWPYDQLLLIIPIIAIMTEMIKRQYPFLLTASIFLLFDILSLVLLLISAKIQMEVLNAIIPLSMYCILFIFILSMKSQKPLNNTTKVIQ